MGRARSSSSKSKLLDLLAAFVHDEYLMRRGWSEGSKIGRRKAQLGGAGRAKEEVEEYECQQNARTVKYQKISKETLEIRVVLRLTKLKCCNLWDNAMTRNPRREERMLMKVGILFVLVGVLDISVHLDDITILIHLLVNMPYKI